MGRFLPAAAGNAAPEKPTVTESYGSSDPGNRRLALRQRPVSTSAIWSNISRPTSGSGSRSCAGHRCVFICADDTHGTAIMIRARQGRAQRGVADRRHARAAHPAISPASKSSSTTTAAPTAEKTGRLRRDSGPPCGRAGLVSRARRRAALRPAGRRFSGRSLRQGNVPQVRHARPIRRQLREVPVDLQRHAT